MRHLDRAAWAGVADRLLAAARPFASPGHGRITFPGAEGGYGRAVDGLEGFARTLLLAGFRIAGERGVGQEELIDFYAKGIATGTDPTAADRWVRLHEHPQAKVEAASIALILDLTRPWLWDTLKPEVQERVVDYLAAAVGDDTYPRINWVWFRLVVQTFLRSVGGPFSLAEMREDLATHDTFSRADGWLADGTERSYDHYVGWALHLYPTLWGRMAGAADLAVDRRERDTAMLDRFLRDDLALVGGDGSPLIQGRSLIYRFAAAAPFWVGAIAEVPSIGPGQLRHAASAVLGHFLDHGVPDERGLLTLGWHREWRRLAQAYSGPGSPYWASKGMLGLALPADHPVWTDVEGELPVETGDVLRAVRAPGWIISGTRADGIVRVVNHGTDHAVEGAAVGDSPLYARIGYSTATSPLLDERGWDSPTDNSVTLVDSQGRATHRAGMRTLITAVADGVGVAGSTTMAHWVDPEPGQRDHGSGRAGSVTPAGHLTVFSLVRGAWEIRLARVDDLAPGIDADRLVLRVGGWPLAGAAEFSPTGVTVVGTTMSSHLRSLVGDGLPGVASHPDGGPLGPATMLVPWLDHAIHIGLWVATLIELSGGDAPPEGRDGEVELSDLDTDLTGWVRWPDGLTTQTRLHP